MDDELDVLLIEDNPGDARLIEAMLGETGELLQRVEGGASIAGAPQVHHEESLTAGFDRLSEADADVILLDLGLPESTGLDTLATVLERTEFMPVVVLTGLRDEQVGLEAIQRGAQDYLVKDEVTSDLLVRSIHHAIERNRQERERVRQLEQLEALNRLNRITQDITHTVITTSTREDLERAVCERLVESDAYRFAWIGEVDATSDRITPRVVSGVEEGYLDEITVTVDGDTGRGPAGKAVRTHEVQVMENMQTAPEFEPWRAEAEERGYRSGASIPIVYQDFLYGVLNVYAAAPNAFSESEVEIFSRLGDVVGHAITAIERKDALVSDAVLELEFQVTGAAEELVELSATAGALIEVENLVRADDALLAYGRSADVPQEEFRDAADRTDEIDHLRILSSGAEECEFELATSAASALADAVATHGGDITSATIADGEFRFVVEFPPGRDKRQLVDLVLEHCPGATLYAQRLNQRSEREVPNTRSVLQNRLTGKQRAALETAYFAGFFDWPRTTTGQEIADRLGIAPATFSQHLRTAERKFFDAVFGEQQDGRPSAPAERSTDSD